MNYMKKIIKIVLCLIISVFIVPFGIVNASTGEYFYAEENAIFDETVDHNLFVVGNTLNDSGIINGILFAAADNLTSSSTMDYGFVAGNNVSISSEVKNDLFLAGNNVKLNNTTVERDAYIAGNIINISNSIVGSNLFLASSSLKLENVNIIGNVNIDVENLVIGDDVIINGTLLYNEDAKIEGLEKVECRKEVYKDVVYEVTKTKVEKYTEIGMSVGALLLVAIIIIVVYPRCYQKATKDVTFGDTFKYLGLGILLLIAIPIISVLLIFTTLGTPLGIILALAYGVSIYLSLICMGMLIGKALHIKNGVVGTIFGTLIVKGLTYVPYVGGFVLCLSVLIGMGLTLRVIKPLNNKEEDNNQNNDNLKLEESKKEFEEENVPAVIDSEEKKTKKAPKKAKPKQKSKTAKKDSTESE